MAMLQVPVTDEDHIQGDKDAPIVLVEYGDYQCPHCAIAHPIVQRVRKYFGKQLAFVFRNFPLNDIHPEAEGAAEAAEFAGSKGKFWEMHDGIFENQEMLGGPLLIELAERLKLSATELETALESGEFAPRVKSDFVGGAKSGVHGTPTFFINAQRHVGSFAYEDLVAAISEIV